MKYNKNADTLLFLLLFTMGQREKIYLKNIICECKCSKKVKKAGSGSTLPQYLPNPKSKFQVKFIFT